DDLQPVQPGSARQVAEPRHAIAEQDHCEGGRQREADPGRHRTEQAGAHQSDRDPGLAAGRAGQELPQRDDVGIGAVVEPFAALDEFGAVVTEMGDRSAEAGQAEPQEDAQDFPCRAALGRARLRLVTGDDRFGRPLHQLLGGRGAVNWARSAKPSASSIAASCLTASAKPSLPNCRCSMSSKVWPMSCNCRSDSPSLQAGKTIVSSRAAWLSYISSNVSNERASVSASPIAPLPV